MSLIDSLIPSSQSGATIDYTEFNPIVLDHNNFILNTTNPALDTLLEDVYGNGFKTMSFASNNSQYLNFFLPLPQYYTGGNIDYEIIFYNESPITTNTTISFNVQAGFFYNTQKFELNFAANSNISNYTLNVGTPYHYAKTVQFSNMSILNPTGATNMIYGKITVNTTADSGNINISHLKFYLK